MKLYKCTHSTAEEVFAYFLLIRHANDYQAEFFDGDIVIEEVECEITEINKDAK